MAGLGLAVPRIVLAQTAARNVRVGTLDDASENSRPMDWGAFRSRLHALGWIEGKNTTYEARYARGKHERLPALAAELVSTEPQVIVSAGTPAAKALIGASSRIPIVFVDAGDPVGTGLVASLSRPGGNVTGISSVGAETTQKVLELMREISPGIRRIGYFGDGANRATVLAYKKLSENAGKLNLSVRMLEAIGQAALERAFATIRQERIQGIIVSNSGTVLEHRDQIISFATQHKLPLASGRREYPDAGGLFSYGSDRRSTFERAAEHAHRILQGAKPADLPVEQVSIVRAVLNLKVARAIGIRIPDSVRLRADEVIE